MGLPSKKRPRSEGGGRSGHLRLVAPSLTRCANCKAMIRPHTMCGQCGYYRGRKVIEVESTSQRHARRDARAARRQS